ncbi:hypothetical protein [Pseudolactococcus hodotermopsidis]|nr:hypothetical protein [Lactococcus hodotermopsidis]
MENNENRTKEKLPTGKYEVKIGRTIYIINRKFNPKATKNLSNILLRIMLQDK